MKIGFIAPYHDLVEIAEHVKKSVDVELIVREATYTQALDEAKEMENQGVEAIISRGATRAYIEKYCNLPVINCNYGLIDVIYALQEAKKYGNTVGVITFTPHDWMKSMFEELFNMEIIFVDGYNDEKENYDFVRTFKDQGVSTIVGGIVSVELARKFGMRGILIQTRPETIEQSINDAVRVVNAVRKERNEYEKIKQIINYISDAIILTNKDGKIYMMNPSARALVREIADKKNITSIYQVISTPNFINGVKLGSTRFGEIENINGTTVIYNQTPIVINRKCEGLVITIQESARIQNLEKQIRTHLHSKKQVAKYKIESFLGVSQEARDCKEKAIHYAPNDSTVLIIGESGTGKEILAQSIHNASPRRNGPFVAVNCSAIANNLLESELFGYQEGAFTGACKGGKVGLFEVAHQGTIFLDEIGDISLGFQASLLRVLQEREIRRVGSDKVIPIDVRIITATNRDLLKLVQCGEFRMDLYYRICVLEIKVPPLRQRKEDIPLLVESFCQQFGGNEEMFSKYLINRMMEYAWPGNVRELSNYVEKVCLLSPKITPEALFENYIVKSDISDEVVKLGNANNQIQISKGSLEEMEKQIILNMYKECNENKTILAERLNISRVTVWNKLKKYDIVEC